MFTIFVDPNYYGTFSSGDEAKRVLINKGWQVHGDPHNDFYFDLFGTPRLWASIKEVPKYCDILELPGR